MPFLLSMGEAHIELAITCLMRRVSDTIQYNLLEMQHACISRHTTELPPPAVKAIQNCFSRMLSCELVIKFVLALIHFADIVMSRC